MQTLQKRNSGKVSWMQELACTSALFHFTPPPHELDKLQKARWLREQLHGPWEHAGYTGIRSILSIRGSLSPWLSREERAKLQGTLRRQLCALGRSA